MVGNARLSTRQPFPVTSALALSEGSIMNKASPAVLRTVRVHKMCLCMVSRFYRKEKHWGERMKCPDLRPVELEGEKHFIVTEAYRKVTDNKSWPVLSSTNGWGALLLSSNVYMTPKPRRGEGERGRDMGVLHVYLLCTCFFTDYHPLQWRQETQEVTDLEHYVFSKQSWCLAHGSLLNVWTDEAWRFSLLNWCLHLWFFFP